MSLPPGILDPAGPFFKCPVCGYDEDYTKSYDHRECVPKIQNIGWWVCETCQRYPWDCDCPREAECVDCEVSVTDIDGPKCEESPTGYHRWKVTDGDSWKYLFDSREAVTPSTASGSNPDACSVLAAPNSLPDSQGSAVSVSGPLALKYTDGDPY